MACRRCTERGKNWEGDDPKCAFPHGVFTSDNWMCATALALRGVCADLPLLDDAFAIRDDDSSWGVINVIGIELERGYYKTLWLSWYKNRGRTDGILLLDDGSVDTPTLDDCERVLLRFA